MPLWGQFIPKTKNQYASLAASSIADAAINYHSNLVRVIPAWRYRPSRRLIYTENCTGDTEYTAGTLCKLKCKIKYKFQGSSKVKLNFSFWPNWTRPALSCKFSYPTRPDPARPDPWIGSRVVQLWGSSVKSMRWSQIVQNRDFCYPTCIRRPR